MYLIILTGIFLKQSRNLLLRWKFTKTVFCTSRSPLKLFIYISFYEWLIASRILQHGRAYIHEIIHTFRSREQPTHTVLAKIMASTPMKPTNNWLSRCDRERRARK